MWWWVGIGKVMFSLMVLLHERDGDNEATGRNEIFLVTTILKQDQYIKKKHFQSILSYSTTKDTLTFISFLFLLASYKFIFLYFITTFCCLLIKCNPFIHYEKCIVFVFVETLAKMAAEQVYFVLLMIFYMVSCIILSNILI